jgi:hypothetical protein
MYIDPSNASVANYIIGPSNYRWLPSFVKTFNFSPRVNKYRLNYRSAKNATARQAVLNEWIPVYKNWLKKEYAKNEVKRVETKNFMRLVQQRKNLLRNLKNVENKLRITYSVNVLGKKV